MRFKEAKREIHHYQDLLKLSDEEIRLLEEKASSWERTTKESQREYEKALDNERYLKYYYFIGGLVTPILINRLMEK